MTTFKESSKIELEIEDDDSSNTASVMGELEVETEDGDLEDSEYPVSFSCASPELEQELDGHPEVEDGEGDFDTEISLTNDVAYNGCEVSIGDDLYVALPLFKVQAESEDKKEEEEDDDDENEKRDKGGVKTLPTMAGTMTTIIIQQPRCRKTQRSTSTWQSRNPTRRSSP